MIYLNMETTDVPAALSELKALGYSYVASRAAPSWDGRPPETLIIASLDAPWTQDCERDILELAKRHQQDCIAIRFAPNEGVTIGSKPVDYSEEYFATE